MASRKIIFPQSPMVDIQTGYLALEWFMWFQNPQFLSIVLGTPIDVINGGTGLASGTSGGILGFVGSTTMASSVALTNHAIVLGGGAGHTPTPLGSLGTTTTVLHGNASGAPTFGAVDLTADVSGTLPATHGGTDNASYTVGDILYASTTTALSKLIAGTSTYVLTSNGAGMAPSWQAEAHVGTVTSVDVSGGTTGLTTSGGPITGIGTITLAGTLVAGNGGTGISSYAVGDLLYANTTTTLAKLADVATGNAVISGGVTTAPAWGKIGLTTHISGTLGVDHGGTGVATLTGIPLASGTSAFTALEYVDWTTPTFNAGDYTANNADTWTVDSGDVTTFIYTIVGKMMTVAITLATTSITLGTANTLQILIPGGRTSTKTVTAYAFINDNGTGALSGFLTVAAGSTTLFINKSPVTAFTISTNNTSVRGVITFQIN